MSSPSISAEPPYAGAPPDGGEPGRGRAYLVTAMFLAPAGILLSVWILYPLIYTIWRSFYDRSGANFIWFDNYETLFTTDTTRTAIRNNAVWVAVVPALVTAIGLIFAVLTERIRWGVAFKIAVFMPMAVSLFAAGVIWRIMYQQEPSRGALNAIIASVHDKVQPPGPLSDAFPSGTRLTGTPATGIVLKTAVRPGSVALLPLTGIPPDQVPSGSVQARQPTPKSGSITGAVWRDFKPGGGTPGKLEKGEVGLPSVTVVLRDASGKTIGSTKSADNGDFAFTGLKAGTYKTEIGSDTFRKPYGGISWLGSKLINPS